MTTPAEGPDLTIVDADGETLHAEMCDECPGFVGHIDGVCLTRDDAAQVARWNAEVNAQ